MMKGDKKGGGIGEDRKHIYTDGERGVSGRWKCCGNGCQ